MMPEERQKCVNSINYRCGRKPLIEISSMIPKSIYFTNAPMEFSNSYIDSLDIQFVGDNSLRDFSGYKYALRNAVMKSFDDIILCNSSCPPQALKAIIDRDDVQAGAIVSPGMKSFYRYDGFKFRIAPHLQSYCLRIYGRNLILRVLEYVEHVEDIFKQLSFNDDSQFKEYLIRHCEVGLSSFTKAYGRNLFLSMDGSLVDLNCLTTAHKLFFFDSRRKDNRFV